MLRLTRRTAPAGWLILVSEPPEDVGSDPATLAAVLGISSRAAELVAAMLEGETLNAFCARQNMSRNTAKYHLRAAFHATGTSRQADLLRRATAVVRDLAL